MSQFHYRTEHARLVDAGWAYRIHTDRGWVIYRDPATGNWHTREDALHIYSSRATEQTRMAS